MTTLAKTPPGKRRWFTYSLRSLFLFVTLVAIVLGAVVRPAVEQRHNVEALRALGCDVGYGHPGTDSFVKMLSNMFGEDLVFNASDLSLAQSREVDKALAIATQLPIVRLFALEKPVTDSQLAQVENLVALKVLCINKGDHVTDVGVAHLGRLTALESLELNGSQVTGAGLAQLKALPGLKRLVLRDSPGVTDAGLKEIRDLHPLQWLAFSGAAVTDAGLIHLEGSSNLKYLGLYDVPVSDAGLRHLKGLSALETLSLGKCNVRGPGLAHLKGSQHLVTLHLTSSDLSDDGLGYFNELPAITALGLYCSNITDAGLAKLESLSKLEHLELGQCQVSAEGVQRLKRKLHLAHVYVDDDLQRKLDALEKSQTSGTASLEK